MKWIKPLSYILFIFTLIGGVYLVVFYLPHRHEKARHQSSSSFEKEREWNILLEHAQMEEYLHHYEEAELEYRQLLKIRPNSLDVKTKLAQFLYYQKKYSDALDILQTIPQEKINPSIVLLLADIYLAQDKYSEAENLYRGYLKEFPQDEKILIQLAQLLSWEKKYDESIQIYQSLLARDPQNIQLRRKYARALMWMGNYPESVKEFKKTIKEK